MSLRLVVLLAVLVLAGPAVAAPEAEPWPRWEAFDPASSQRVDHRAWGDFLERHVHPGADGVNRVAYAQVGASSRRALDGYLAALAGQPVAALGRDEQMAYWINLYNALTVKVILDHYPVSSIRDIDISPGLFSDGPWGAKLVTVDGVALSLDDIEHRILRPIWRDARIHYAVNCASIGCPNLARRPYTAAELDGMLDKAASDYVNSPRGARFDGGRLIVSRIYDWYAADFGGNEAGVLDHLRAYARGAQAARFSGADGIDGYDYDWSLNATAP